MKIQYLLSNSKWTANKIEAIRDALILEFAIYKKELPYDKSKGFSSRFTEIDEKVFENAVRDSINTMINSISTKFETQITIKAVNFDTRKITVNLLIENTPSNYDILF